MNYLIRLVAILKHEIAGLFMVGKDIDVEVAFSVILIHVLGIQHELLEHPGIIH